jgi:hypothetical protein
MIKKKTIMTDWRNENSTNDYLEYELKKTDVLIGNFEQYI